jgi:alpha-glucosidase (family GH31 glycosyl hydrolase)
MKDRNCPVRVFHLDCFWMKGYEWYTKSTLTISLDNSSASRCSFTFDPDNFPDPKAYLSEIKSKYGVKICVWSEYLLIPLKTMLTSHLWPISQLLHLPVVPYLPRGRQRGIFYQAQGRQRLAVEHCNFSKCAALADELITQMGFMATRTCCCRLY